MKDSAKAQLFLHNASARRTLVAVIPIYLSLVGNALAGVENLWQIRLAETSADIPQSVFAYEGNDINPPSNVCGVRLEGIDAYDWGTSIFGGCPCTSPGSGGTPNISNPDFIEVRNIPALGGQCGPATSAAEVVVEGQVVDFANLGIAFLHAQPGKYRWLDSDGDVIPPPETCAPDCTIDPVLWINPSIPPSASGVSLWTAVLNSAVLAELLENELKTMQSADYGTDAPKSGRVEPMRRVAVALQDGLANAIVARAVEPDAADEATPNEPKLVEAFASTEQCVAILTSDQHGHATDGAERVKRLCGAAARSTLAAARGVALPMGFGVK